MSTKKIIVIAVVTLCVIGLSVGLSYYVTNRSDVITTQEDTETPQELEKALREVELLTSKVSALEGQFKALEATVETLEEMVAHIELVNEYQMTEGEGLGVSEDGDERESSGEIILQDAVTVEGLNGMGDIYTFCTKFNDFADKYYVSNRIEFVHPKVDTTGQPLEFWIDLNGNIGVNIVQNPDTKKITNIDVYAMEFVMRSEAAFLAETIRTSAQALGKHSEKEVQAILNDLCIDGQILPDYGHYTANSNGVSYVMDISEEDAFSANITIN